MTLLIILFNITGCLSLPTKPNVEICTIDIPRSQLICSPTEKIKNVDELEFWQVYHFVHASPQKRHIPLLDADKFISFSPMDWQQVTEYMKKLRSAAETSCQ